MEKTELPFDTGIVDLVEEFEQWMKDEEIRMKGGGQHEKTGQVGVDPGLYIGRNRLGKYNLRPKTRHTNRNVLLIDSLYLS